MQAGKQQLCNKGYEHTSKPILMICLNKECQNKRLCCLTCIDQLHRKHELISLAKFEGMLSVLSIPKDPQVQSSIKNVLKQYENQLFKSLEKLITQFKKDIDQCQKKIKDLLSILYDSISMGNQNANVVQLLYSDFTNDRVCKYLNLIKEAENINYKTPQTTLKTIQNSDKIFQKSVVECQNQYKKGIQDLKKGIQKLKSNLSQQNSTKLNKFSKTNKAACLALNETDDNVKRIQGAGGYPIVLFDGKLTENNDNVNVTITQQPGNKGIWMGVCVLDIVKNFNFQSCYGIGKGTWAIDQVGQTHVSAYSWSHHDTNYNSQPKVGFQFSVGDIVNIRVDFTKGTVIFSKGTAMYEQPIKTDIGDVYAFVGPTHLGDSLSIV